MGMAESSSNGSHEAVSARGPAGRLSSISISRSPRVGRDRRGYVPEDAVGGRLQHMISMQSTKDADFNCCTQHQYIPPHYHHPQRSPGRGAGGIHHSFAPVGLWQE